MWGICRPWSIAVCCDNDRLFDYDHNSAKYCGHCARDAPANSCSPLSLSAPSICNPGIAFASSTNARPSDLASEARSAVVSEMQWNRSHAAFMATTSSDLLVIKCRVGDADRCSWTERMCCYGVNISLSIISTFNIQPNSFSRCQPTPCQLKKGLHVLIIVRNVQFLIAVGKIFDAALRTSPHQIST